MFNILVSWGQWGRDNIQWAISQKISRFDETHQLIGSKISEVPKKILKKRKKERKKKAHLDPTQLNSRKTRKILEAVRGKKSKNTTSKGATGWQLTSQHKHWMPGDKGVTSSKCEKENIAILNLAKMSFKNETQNLKSIEGRK